MASHWACLIVALLAVASHAGAAAPTLTLSADHAFIKNKGAARSGHAIKGWTSTKAIVGWEVDFKATGIVAVSTVHAAPGGIAGSQVAVTLGGQQVTGTLADSKSWKKFIPQKLGELTIAKTGKQTVTIQALTRKSVYVCDLRALTLEGDAVRGATITPQQHGAPSVHLWHGPARPSTVFYNEIIVQETAPTTFFMACGFNRGYFGIQERRGPDDRLVIFSVWDPRGHKADARLVKKEDRVQVLYGGEGVQVSRFGGEGTGGKSIFPYRWDVGQVCRFRLEAEVEKAATTYTAYFYLTRQKTWKRLATFRVPGIKGQHLRGYYSFIEDWTGRPKLRRRATFGNTWIRTPDGTWAELTRATFTTTAKPHFNNIDAGVDPKTGRFYLATGGDTSNTNPRRSKLTRKPTGKLPDFARDADPK